MRRTSSTALAVGLAMALSGCTLIPSAGAGTPAPAALSIEEAATAYSGTICTFNDGARAFAATWTDDAAELRDLQEAASLAAIEAEAAKDELESAAWPADLAPDMAVVLEYLDERIAKLTQVIRAETLDELDSIELARTPEEVDESAARIEEALSLVDFCPQTSASAEEPTQEGDELVGTTWTGTDSDGDETTITFSSGGAVTVLVGATTYEGDWVIAGGEVALTVSTPAETLEYSGNWSPGVTGVFLSGTASNGHTFDVLVTSF